MEMRRQVMGAYPSFEVLESLKTVVSRVQNFEHFNRIIFEHFRVLDFIDNQAEFLIFKSELENNTVSHSIHHKIEYGDFQTNSELAEIVTLHVKTKGVSPQVLIEPTCGRGNFIVASLRAFPSLMNIYAIEIFRPYLWDAKFNVINEYLANPTTNKPEIQFIHANVFDYAFDSIAERHSSRELLVIGNPPWVTNSKLSALESFNLPTKSNFKNHTGIEAITGKGNFDIAEFITLMMLKAFHHSNGTFAFLVKNSVVKNVLLEQKTNPYQMGELAMLSFDSLKEFRASVDASMLYCRFNQTPSYQCSQFNLYDSKYTKKFGWVEDKFVSDVEKYLDSHTIDGTCPKTWRQGVKHDCTSVMEFERTDDAYINSASEIFHLESEIVYGLIKSSDLKGGVLHKSRKFTLITQKRIGQSTEYLKDFPLTYDYLHRNRLRFEARKSSIYRQKPAFSIFGIGDYSFKPYKVAISGMYKAPTFTLLLPQEGKPLMLDDTCYFLAFDNLDFACYALILLTHATTVELLESITFPDAKRRYTKDILMRIDLINVAKSIGQQELEGHLRDLNLKFKLNVSSCAWDTFLSELSPASQAIEQS